jgi:hypothetical protein
MRFLLVGAGSGDFEQFSGYGNFGRIDVRKVLTAQVDRVIRMVQIHKHGEVQVKDRQSSTC